MIKHEEKYCPRCNTLFECKVGSISLCQCTAVILTEEERNFMRNKFDDCLCASCMKQVKSAYQNEKLRQKMKSILGGFYKKPGDK
ncbi:cysteine-rich CWC family protein [Marivirga lumbricoides]|uniref:cysteine-rich CWC family protein n=1 Tax=Marivirga lumbricoides TaxID=1046115 RepID=UPI001662D2F5